MSPPAEQTPPPRTAKALGAGLVACGFLIPALVSLWTPADGQWLQTALLALVAAGMANIKFSIGFLDRSVTPIGAPIVFAAVVCSPAQAMLVAIVGLVANVDALRRLGPWPSIQSGGIGALTAGLTSVTSHAFGAGFDDARAALLVTIGATALYLCLDFLAYAVWELVETGSARPIARYFAVAGPTDIGITGTAVLMAAPFHDDPWLVTAVLGGYSLGVAAIYRLSASEHRHRTQSQHLRDVFSRYVPESVADRLADQTHDIELGGETREVSVLFCDIRGFTAWSEQHEAHTVVLQLNRLLGSLTEAVMRHEGTLDKFTGDGLMAFWGAPLDQPEHARLACRAAADIHAALAACNEERIEAGMPPFEIGVGIATGPAVVGNIGHEQRLDYTAIGDTVNLAARLEAATKDLGRATVISDATAALLPAAVAGDWERLEPVRVKGKREPVAIRGGTAEAGRDDPAASQHAA